MKNYLKELRKENNKLGKNLSKENNDILTNIIVYIKCKEICEIDVEIIRKDLIGMALESQLREESLNSLIGDDYKSFSESLIKNCDKESLFKTILDYSYALITTVAIMFLIQSISPLVVDKTLSIPISLGFLIQIVLVLLSTTVILKYVGKTSFDNSKGFWRPFFKMWLLMFGMFILVILPTIFFRKIIIFNVSLLVVIPCLIICAIASHFIAKAYTNKIFESKYNKLGDI